MKKTTKGAIAASAAGILLLGGAGSLAYWTDSDTVDGQDFATGQLSLTESTTDALADCDEWTFDDGEVTADKVYDPVSDKIVPGDVISKLCAFDVLAEGEHLRATVAAEQGTNTISTELASVIDISTTDLAVSSTADFATATPLATGAVSGKQELTEANDGDTLYVKVSVTFDSAADNSTQSNVANGDLTALLDDINIVTTQVHS